MVAIELKPQRLLAANRLIHSAQAQSLRQPKIPVNLQNVRTGTDGGSITTLTPGNQARTWYAGEITIKGRRHKVDAPLPDVRSRPLKLKLRPGHATKEGGAV